MCIKTKAKKSVTITITIAIILFSCNAWDDYKVRYKDSIRSVEIENIERLRKCKTSKNGYKTYQCDDKKAINAAKVLRFKFTTALNIIVAMCLKSEITKSEAEEMIDTLDEFGWYNNRIIKKARQDLNV